MNDKEREPRPNPAFKQSISVKSDRLLLHGLVLIDEISEFPSGQAQRNRALRLARFGSLRAVRSSLNQYQTVA
ncbi:MAG: hypothetical protein RQ741_01370 [Wenzhouxiangellaceae bacterium]|nr:hypothetical protein [Wenzhouxiangellaceae bacterium]